ncbi:MAG: hypothetical protein J7576_09655 [Siphonobacter aquaeclarae]|nr:hypothetical protein [Siphonobacter aquaeclarae]
MAFPDPYLWLLRDAGFQIIESSTRSISAEWRTSDKTTLLVTLTFGNAWRLNVDGFINGSLRGIESASFSNPDDFHRRLDTAMDHYFELTAPFPGVSLKKKPFWRSALDTVVAGLLIIGGVYVAFKLLQTF